MRDVPGIQAELAADGAGVFCVDGPGGIGRIRRARALIAARRPEIVHTTLFEADITGRLAAAAAGVPVVSSLVSSAYDVEQAAAPGLRPGSCGRPSSTPSAPAASSASMRSHGTSPT